MPFKHFNFLNLNFHFLGVRPYKCNMCEKSFTQRCSLESHCLKVSWLIIYSPFLERFLSLNNYSYILPRVNKFYRLRLTNVNDSLLQVHGMQHQYAYKERRTKVYVCEECGHTTGEPEVHYVHLKDNHPYSPALLKFYDKRHFKFTNSSFANMLLQVRS